MERRAPRAAAGVLLILAAGAAGMLVAQRPADAGDPLRAEGLRANRLPPTLDGSPAPPIRLRDARGSIVDTAGLAGRPYLLTFLYTRCRDVCPLIGYEIADALRRLGARARDVRALAVSVDPRGDTPAAARRWVARHRLPSQFSFLLGTGDDLHEVWRDWFAVAGDGRLEDPRAHDASIWLVDGRGRIRGRYSGAEPIAPEDLAHDLRVLLDERAHGPATTGS